MASSEEICSIEKLVDESSYQIWKFQIIITFKASDLLKVINGESLLENQSNDQDKANWLKLDAKAQKIIITTIDRKFMMHIIDCENSKQMFDKIKNIFEKSTSDQLCNMLQQFYTFSYEKGTDMNMHISKIQNIVHKLRALNQNIDENMVISKILSTLPSQYSYFVTAWESTAANEKTLEKLVSRLLTEEKRSNSKENDSEIAFESIEKFCEKCKSKTHYAKFCKKEKGERKCYRCGKHGHIARNCTTSSNNTQARNTIKTECKWCKKTNHREQDCYFRDKRRTNDSKVAFLSENGNLCTGNFVVDSGSSSHMANSKSLFSILEETNSSIQVAKKEQKMTAKGKGSIEGSNCVLNDVLFVPELRRNLISVNMITENNGEVTFTKEKVVIKKNNEKVLEGQKTENGLYVVDIKGKEEACLVEKKEKKIEEWHKKLGHLGFNNMKRLIDLSTGIPLKKNECKKLETCQVCLEAKQTRLPFNSVRHQAKRVLEILHTDICGPIEPTTWNEKRYILTILDDYTHYCRTYLLKNKSEASEYIKEFIQEVEAYHNIRVSKIRSDNGGEYTSTSFKQWCKSKGIILDFTIPYSPQLNGKAERLNRTLLEKARSLIFDKNINKEMWGEAIFVATYLLNRSPTEAVEKTPTECWTGTKPDLSRLQIFGSTAYAKVLGHIRKLDSRSKKYLFVGYAPNGYRLWDEHARKIVIHRDVVFSEIRTNDNEVKLTIEEENKNISIRREEQNDENELEEQNEVQRMEELGEGTDDEIIYKTRSGRTVKRPEKFNIYELNDEQLDESFLTFEEAIKGMEKDKWKKAIDEEKNSLEKNQTWKYVNKDEVKNRKILSSRWIFRIKDDNKYKARLVIKGCQQKSGIDYNETFSPVVNVSSLRILFALAIKYNMMFMKFDIKTAFLYGKLTEDIFMHIPEGFQNENNKNKVCYLQKSLYGLKQAPLKWNETFTNFLKSNALIPLKSDQCLFTNKEQSIYLAIYVDDGLLMYKNKEDLKKIIDSIQKEFETTVCENPDKFLGIEINMQVDEVVLHQEGYIQSTLEKFKMENAKPVHTPMVSNVIDLKSNPNVKYPFREAIGSLLYITNKTRPDIAYPVNFCSRRMENPTDQDVTNVKRIFRYLVLNKNNGIKFSNNSDSKKLVAYCDSDFAGDTLTRKSTTGYIIFFCGGPISWGSRKQPIVSLSSTEAEYIAAAECVKELLYLKTVIYELTGSEVEIELNIDNQSAITMIKTGQFNRRSKHIDVRYHFINEKVREGYLKIKYCATENQLGDILTKPLGKTKFEYLKGQFLFKIMY